MGHDTHFLERLDRVSDAHVERALTLYRDETLLKEVLGRAGLAECVERLAISLDDPIEGPFIIVTRAGRFVTCLGKGMHVTKEPGTTVLTRERLDAAAAKVERMRERLAEVEQLRRAGAEGVGARALRRLTEDGLRFCREDAETLLGVLPLMADTICVGLTRGARWLRDHRREVGYLRFDRLKPREEALAIQFGHAAWGMAHLLAFADHDDVQALFAKIGDTPDVPVGVNALLAMTTFDLGTLTHATRALWLLGRRPRLVLRDVKNLSGDVRRQMRVPRELGLGVIALSSTKLRAEATKALSRGPTNAVDTLTVHEALDEYGRSVGAVVRRVLETPAEIDEAALARGRRFMAHIRNREAELTDELCAAIPEPVARATLGAMPLSWLDGDDGLDRLSDLCATLPWIARAEPAELFLPREYAQGLPVDPLSDARLMIAPYATTSLLTRPKPRVRATEKIGRNDPCACGSGKKHKRCCGP